MKTIMTLLTIGTLALATSAFAGGDACKKCCKDGCATCCKEKGKECGKDCCKAEKK